MLDRTGLRATERIVALAHELLAKRGLDQTIGPDDDLAERGLSSLDTVNLMLAVELEFAIKIPDREMTPANFRSVARIDTLVCKLLGR